MRAMIAVIAGMMLIAASLTFLYPTQPRPTQIVIYDTAEGVNITDQVQHMVGHSTGPVNTAPPTLGALRVLRDDPEARGHYQLDPDLSVHVYLIGVAEDPVFVTFQPSRTGHAGRYEIDLEQVLANAAD